jgi:biofilm PGA synthesis N-glycosyltransferase PgaC
MSSDSTRTTSADSGRGKAKLPAYVLITPARNESDFIELTIKSVIAQTVKPLKWVIVSDGSTDGTDNIVKKYAAEHKWIELVRMPERRERHFAGKVYAFNAGYERVRDLQYDIIGNLDADLSFDDDYFAFVLVKFAENPKLGVGGTPFREGTQQYDYRFTSIEHVSGACQLFRRECFENIGGYTPIQGGGIDLLAVLTARVKGWQTMSFSEKYYLHHRKMGTAKEIPLKARFRDGQKDYNFGSHPVWEIFRVIYQMTKKPFLIGACALFCGYIWNVVRNVKKPISFEVQQLRRREQMQRLQRFLFPKFKV